MIIIIPPPNSDFDYEGFLKHLPSWRFWVIYTIIAIITSVTRYFVFTEVDTTYIPKSTYILNAILEGNIIAMAIASVLALILTFFDKKL